MAQATGEEKNTKFRYLVIDDEIAAKKSYREDFVADLNLPGTEALFVGSCDHALQMIEQHPEISLCFLDYKLPQSDGRNYEDNYEDLPSGMRLIPAIKAIREKFAIIAFSAYLDRSELVEQGKKYSDSNIVAYLQKGDYELFRQAFFQGVELLKTKYKLNLLLHKSISVENRFDYGVLDQDIREAVQQKTNQIKLALKRTRHDIFHIGRYVTEVKASLPHGKFNSWIESELQISRTQAHRFMRVYAEFKDVDLENLEFTPTAMYSLVTKDVSDEAIKDAVKEAKEGKVIDASAAKSIKQKHQNAKKLRQEKNNFNSELNTAQEISERSNEENQNGSLKAKTSVFNQQIVGVIPLQKEWIIGNHRLFCCDPNDEKFVSSLPSKVDLVLCYPSIKNWNFDFDRYTVNNTFYSSEEPYYLNLENVKSEVESCQQRQNDLKLRGLKQANNLALDYTDSGSVVVVCYIPHSKILSLLDKLSCQVYIADPNREKCLDVIKSQELSK